MCARRSDVWAIGVITYFLLCGYTPFDRDSNLEEMQAILVADYSFTPLEYWRGVSQTARDFIRRCLTIDPAARMTAHEALSHPWIADLGKAPADGKEEDLLPTVKKNFNARRTLHAAIDTIRAINQLRAGGAAGMVAHAGAGGVGQANENRRPGPPPNVPQPEEEGPEPMEVDGGMEHRGKGLDSRGNGHGQTEEMIREQERRIRETQQGMWSKR
jgi:serine/threonine protein kinase